MEIIIIPVGDDSGYDAATLMYMSGSVITAIASFIVAKKYRGSHVHKGVFLLGAWVLLLVCRRYTFFL